MERLKAISWRFFRRPVIKSNDLQGNPSIRAIRFLKREGMLARRLKIGNRDRGREVSLDCIAGLNERGATPRRRFHTPRKRSVPLRAGPGALRPEQSVLRPGL